jgi:hypothetical protein
MSLTAEDKVWMAEQLGAIGTALRTEVIEGMRIELAKSIEALRIEFMERIKALRIELMEHNEKTETTLLTEFHKWASPVGLRQRSHAAAMRV